MQYDRITLNTRESGTTLKFQNSEKKIVKVSYSKKTKMMYKNTKREVYVSHIWSYMLSGETWTSRYTESAILF